MRTEVTNVSLCLVILALALSCGCASVQNSNTIAAKGYNDSGMALLHDGNYDAAITSFNAAIGIDPNYGQSYVNRGVAFYSNGDYEMAIADETTALGLPLSPDDRSRAYNSRGLALSSMGDYDAAIADFNEAIRVNPNYASAYSNRGVTFYDKGNYDQAYADFTKAIDFNACTSPPASGEPQEMLPEPEEMQMHASMNPEPEKGPPSDKAHALEFYRAAQVANKMRIDYLNKKLAIVQRWAEEFNKTPRNGFKDAKIFYQSRATRMNAATAKIQATQERIKTLHDKAVADANALAKKMAANPRLVVSKNPTQILAENAAVTANLKTQIRNRENVIKQIQNELRDMPEPPVDQATNEYDFDPAKFALVLADWHQRVSTEIDTRTAADKVYQKAIDDAQKPDPPASNNKEGPN